MNAYEFMRKHHAPAELTFWSEWHDNDMAETWKILIDRKKVSWLMWIATETDVFPAATSINLLCDVVRHTALRDGRVLIDLLVDERSKQAICAAEKYANGSISKDELKIAVDDSYKAIVDIKTPISARYEAAWIASRVAAYAYGAFSCASDIAHYAISAASQDALERSQESMDAMMTYHYAAIQSQLDLLTALENPFRKKTP